MKYPIEMMVSTDKISPIRRFNEVFMVKKLKLIFNPITRNKNGIAREIERKNTFTNDPTFNSSFLFDLFDLAMNFTINWIRNPKKIDPAKELTNSIILSKLFMFNLS